MAKPAEQFRASDVTRWGIIALVTAALAVVSANISALLPADALSGLHATRLGGVSVGELRARVAGLQKETAALRGESGELAARFSLDEDARRDATRRIGALEASLPRLLEALAAPPGIDRTTTASIDAPRGEVLEAEGGAVRIVRTPLAPPPPVAQPMPAPAQAPAFAPNGEGRFGVAIGPRVTLQQAQATWSDLSHTLGPTILGLTPLLAEESGGGSDADTRRIVLGPAADLAEATALCGRLERVAVACQPMPYTGTPLAP